MSKAIDKIIAERLREMGFENTALYTEKFGYEKWDPAWISGVNKHVEEQCEKYVDEGHTWDYYFEYPEEAIF